MRLTNTETARARGLVGWGRLVVALTFVVTLLGLGAANVALRASWNEVEDGVLWTAGPQGVTAAQIAERAPAFRAGVRQGDLLLAINGVPVSAPADVLHALHQGDVGTRLNYALLRLGSHQVMEIELAPIPRGNNALYYILATIGMFSLVVGAAVRLRRPGRSGDTSFLLAVPGVFWHVHVLVQRAARPARLGVLLGRRRLDPAAPAAVPALHAGVPRAPAQLAPSERGSGAAAPALRACAPARHRPHRRRRPARRWTRGSSRA